MMIGLAQNSSRVSQSSRSAIGATNRLLARQCADDFRPRRSIENPAPELLFLQNCSSLEHVVADQKCPAQLACQDAVPRRSLEGHLRGQNLKHLTKQKLADETPQNVNG